MPGPDTKGEAIDLIVQRLLEELRQRRGTTREFMAADAPYPGSHGSQRSEALRGARNHLSGAGGPLRGGSTAGFASQ
jgi:hypothetical protein